VWEFSLEKPDSDGSVILRSILDNQHYPYSFIAPYPNPTAEIDGPLVRGPFLLDRLTPDSFESITAGEAWNAIDVFLREWDPPATREELDIDALVGDVIDTADEIFRPKAFRS